MNKEERKGESQVNKGERILNSIKQIKEKKKS